jgi:CubicO group peptidase (beta-lactamase class C family)
MNLIFAALALSRQAFDMQAALDMIRTKHSVVGLGCAVIPLDGRGNVWTSGAREAGKPDAATKNDTWLIGANVQAMSGVLVADEVQKGTLKWNQSIAKLIGVTKIDPSYGADTIESLVTMTGGLDEDPPKGWAAYAGSDMTQARQKVAVDQFGAKAAKAVAGQYCYSNSSYVFLGHILERMNDLDLEDVMQRELWYPIPLDAAAWGPNADSEPVGHDATGMSHPGADDPALLDGAGRARMSIRNWAGFLRRVMVSFKGHDQYVPEAYAAELNAAAAESYCLGWTKTTRPWAKQFVLWQNWDNTLNHAEAWVDPIGGIAYIAVSNQGGPQAQQACDEAIASMIANGAR